MTKDHRPFVALGSRLRGVPEVVTLGVRPNFLDYSPAERRLIFEAPMILYPTRQYAQFLNTLGKRVFPSLETSLYADEKVKQTTLFYMAGIPHPRTRIYYPRHHPRILKDFQCPFIAKLPKASAQGRGVFKIDRPGQLQDYLSRTKVAYIQEYLPHERDIRVILINYRLILAYWRVKAPGDYRTNLAQGGSLNFEDVPEEGVEVAMDAAIRCRFNDVGLDLIRHQGRWYVIEANMKYGRKGLKACGMDLKEILRQKLLSGELTATPEP